MSKERSELVFVVRMWLPAGDPHEEPAWRGSVHDVVSGQRFYVVDPRDVAEFIATRMAQRSTDRRAGPESG